MGPFDLAASVGANATGHLVQASADSGGGACIDLNMGFGVGASAGFGTSFVWHLTPPEGSRSIRIMGTEVWKNEKCMEQIIDDKANARAERKKKKKKIKWGFGK